MSTWYVYMVCLHVKDRTLAMINGCQTPDTRDAQDILRVRHLSGVIIYASHDAMR